MKIFEKKKRFIIRATGRQQLDWYVSAIMDLDWRSAFLNNGNTRR